MIIEFRKYECGEDYTDYVMFCGKDLSCVLVCMVSLQEGEWYTSEAVWEMDFLPETAEELCEVQLSHNNDTRGWSCGSWKNLSDIPEDDKSAAHDNIVIHFGL